MKEKTIMKIGIILIGVNTIVSVLDYIMNGELTNVSGYFMLVGFAGLMVFVLGVVVGCGELMNKNPGDLV